MLGATGTGERRPRHAVATVEATTAALPTVRPRRSWIPVVVPAAAYLAFSLAMQHRALGSFTTVLIGRVTADADMFSWWLNWVPWSVLHGQNPLLTDCMHYPYGLNALWNTSVPLLGVLLSPITLTAGAVAAYNAGVVLGPVVSGVALVLALRPYVRGWVARGIGGALYAFAPFHLAHAVAGHLNLTWSVLPPVLLLLAHHLFAAPVRRPWRLGAVTGSVLVAQLVLYTQMLAIGAVFLLVGAVLLALRFPRRVCGALPGLGKAALACVGVFAVVGAYPLYLILAGPVRPHGSVRNIDATGADLANLVVPTRMTAIRPAPDGLADELAGHVGEQGGYVGVAMLALVLVAVLVVRSTTLRLVAAVGAVAWVCSLGTGVTVLGADTGITLPWTVMRHVPLLSEIEPVRIQVVVGMCVAVVVAMWIDAVPAVAHAGVARAGAVALSGFALLSWIPADAQEVQPAPVPQLFAAPGTAFAPDDVAEIYPRVTAAWDGGAQGLRWQVASGMAFRTPGGYFIASDPDDDVVIESKWNRYQIGAKWVADGKGQPSDRYTAAAAGDLRELGVTVVTVVPQDPAADPAVLEWTRRVTGDPGRFDRGVWLFRPAPV